MQTCELGERRQGTLGSVRGCAECGRKGYRARLSQRVSGMGPGARSARTRSERSPGSHRGALWPILFYSGSSDSGAGRVQAMQRSLNTETAQGMGDPVGRGGRGGQGRVVGEGASPLDGGLLRPSRPLPTRTHPELVDALTSRDLPWSGDPDSCVPNPKCPVPQSGRRLHRGGQGLSPRVANPKPVPRKQQGNISGWEETGPGAVVES